GVLAAIALPQSQVTVEKARMSEAFTTLKSVKESEERYYLANGTYVADWEELDISLPGTILSSTIIKLPSGWRMYIDDHGYIYAVNKSNTNTLIFSYTHSASPDLRRCQAKQNNKVAHQVCKGLGGKDSTDSTGCIIGNCTVYTL
ncbi:MAG: hypothetical protein MJ053_07245, partial [Elusimicrobiaceae bacterium]|nr:hypothetical protein [Elusimicrobiaceae bacterium]